MYQQTRVRAIPTISTGEMVSEEFDPIKKAGMASTDTLATHCFRISIYISTITSFTPDTFQISC